MVKMMIFWEVTADCRKCADWERNAVQKNLATSTCKVWCRYLIFRTNGYRMKWKRTCPRIRMKRNEHLGKHNQFFPISASADIIIISIELCHTFILLLESKPQVHNWSQTNQLIFWKISSNDREMVVVREGRGGFKRKSTDMRPFHSFRQIHMSRYLHLSRLVTFLHPERR